jgi:predicted RNA binding protein YcfA (HicA-like mRNA interferase family)
MLGTREADLVVIPTRRSPHDLRAVGATVDLVERAGNRLRREGWAERTGRGSHAVFTKPGQRNISVPNHPGDLSPGVRSIAQAAGWEWPPRR